MEFGKGRPSHDFVSQRNQFPACALHHGNRTLGADLDLWAAWIDHEQTRGQDVYGYLRAVTLVIYGGDLDCEAVAITLGLPF